jgi:hypothetical protein
MRSNNRLDDRPIKSKGGYNLNFIDWNNEWERVSEVEAILEDGGHIEDQEEYNRVYNNVQKEKEKHGVNKLLFPTVKPNVKKECYICLKAFNVKSIVLRLPCKHEFDDGCITPWIKTNHTCPICKFSLKKEEVDYDNNILSQN